MTFADSRPHPEGMTTNRMPARPHLLMAAAEALYFVLLSGLIGLGVAVVTPVLVSIGVDRHAELAGLAPVIYGGLLGMVSVPVSYAWLTARRVRRMPRGEEYAQLWLFLVPPALFLLWVIAR